MSSSKSTRGLSYLALGLIAAAIGFIAGRSSRPAVVPPALPPPALPSPESNNAATPLVAPAPPDPEPDTVRSTALRTLAALRDEHPGAVQIPVLTKREQLDSGFAALLGLNTVQVDELNRAITKARKDLNSFAARNAQVATAPTGEIVVTVPPITEGAAIYDELMDAFARTLGSERADAFKRLFGDQFSESFQNFGAERRVLTIAENLPKYVDWKDGGVYVKDERWTATGKLETLAFRVFPDRLEFLLPHLQWIEPIITSQLPPVKSPVRPHAP